MVPVPDTSVHVPVPTVGELPAMVVLLEEMQMVWLGPAFDGVGASSTVIVMVEEEGGHTPLEIVH
jgi:hypothetical protein